MTNDFIHLRVRSSFSLSEGAITPTQLVRLCKEQHMPAVAITDHNNLFASLEFSNIACKEGIQPIIGALFHVLYDENTAITPTMKWEEMVFIAKNEQGYYNLLKLNACAYDTKERAENPHITLAEIERFQEGLICLSGGPYGPIGSQILAKREDEAQNRLLHFKAMFGDRFYVEIMRHGTADEEATEEFFVKKALEHEIPLVATNDAYFSDRNMHQAHDALLCIAEGRYVVETDRHQVTEEHFFKSSRQMKSLFADLPEAYNNTNLIARRCHAISENRAPILPGFPCGEGRNEADELAHVAKEGLKTRLEEHVYPAGATEAEKETLAKPYFERLEFELGVITTMDFPGYFLIVSDFIRWSKSQEIPVGPGRGSGAGSVVAWSLEITDLDPLRFGLLFERFLNPERVSMPDFDIDFCQERREEVILYVQEKYGAENVAQIITFGKLQAKAVLRDVGRVLQMPYSQVDRITKMIPFNPIDPVTLSKALDMDKMLRDLRDNDPEIKMLIDIGLKLEGLNRHASTHAAGVVIGDRPLDELIPVYRDPRAEMLVTGYSMKYAESAGLVKFDFLGLKTLTVIAKSCAFLKAKGVDLDISKIPLDDRKSYDLLAIGDSVGVFQLESAGMRDTLRKLRPDNLEDIIALISLYRPGPMDNIPSYIARKHGEETPDYLHEMLEEVLKETYGVIIYQEQVMQIAQIMGGYSLGAADLLRRAMGKKIAAEMDAQRKIFVEGAIKNKVDQKQASGIFDLVAKFAGYGFNKSHAAAYAMISYQTAYLKANHMVEFLSASMNLDIHDTDKIATFKQEIVAHEIEVLSPDINASSAYFKPEYRDDFPEGAIRYGLGALKNVGIAAMEAMEAERAQNGPYTSIFDFVSRVDSQVLNKRQFENLIKSGCFDQLHDNRKSLLDALEAIMRYGQSMNQEKNSSQASLFGALDAQVSAEPKLETTSDWKPLEKMQHEFDAVGLYLKAHPLDLYSEMLDILGTKIASTLEENLKDGSSAVNVAGVVIAKKIRSSPRGRFATVSMSDSKGLFEISIFDEDLLSHVRDLLEAGNMLLIDASARKDEGGIRMIAEKITPLDQALNRKSVKAVVTLAEGFNADILHQTITEKSEPAIVSLDLRIPVEEHYALCRLPKNYAISPSRLSQLEALEMIEKVDLK